MVGTFRSNAQQMGKKRREKKVFFLSYFFEISSNQRTPPACRHFPLPPSWPGWRRINKTSAKALSLLCFNISCQLRLQLFCEFLQRAIGRIGDPASWECQCRGIRSCSCEGWRGNRVEKHRGVSYFISRSFTFQFDLLDGLIVRKKTKSWTNGHFPLNEKSAHFAG